MMTPAPLVFSMSDIESWKRCRKKFDFAVQRGLEPGGDKNVAMQKGTDFHKIMELAADGRDIIAGVWNDVAMVDVAREYLKHHPLPANIISAEEPIYTFVCNVHQQYTWSKVLVEQTPVYIRTTFDLIYSPNLKTGAVRGRDYKTFSQAPTLDVDLDFQGRIYECVLAKKYGPDIPVDFEWEYVRSEVGRMLQDGKSKTTPKGKIWVEWPIEDRYVNVPMVSSDTERATTWRELQETVADLVRSIDENRLYRIDLKTGPHSCSMCPYNTICKTEYAHGELSQMDIDLLAKRADPGERATKAGILADPRVIWADEQALRDPNQPNGRDVINNIYGQTGLDKVKA